MKAQATHRLLWVAPLLVWMLTLGTQAQELRQDGSATDGGTRGAQPDVAAESAQAGDDFFDPRAPICDLDLVTCPVESEADCRWQPPYYPDPSDPVEVRMHALGIRLDGGLDEVTDDEEQKCRLLCSPGCDADTPRAAFFGDPAVAWVDCVPDLGEQFPFEDGDAEQPREVNDPSGFNVGCSFVWFAPDSNSSDGIDDSFLYFAWDISEFADTDGSAPVPYDSDDNGSACVSAQAGVWDYWAETYRTHLEPCEDLLEVSPCRVREEHDDRPLFVLEMYVSERTTTEGLLTHLPTHTSVSIDTLAFPTADGTTDPGNACIDHELLYCAEGNNVELVIKRVETLGIFGSVLGRCSDNANTCRNDAECSPGQSCLFMECAVDHAPCEAAFPCGAGQGECIPLVQPDSDQARLNRMALAELVAYLEGGTDGDDGDEEAATVAVHTPLPDIEVTKLVRCVEEPLQDDWYRHVDAWPGAEVEFEITITNYGNEDLAVTVRDVFEAVGAQSDFADCELLCDFLQAEIDRPREGTANFPVNETTAPGLGLEADFFDISCDNGFLGSIVADQDEYLGVLLGARASNKVCRDSCESCLDDSDCDQGEECAYNPKICENSGVECTTDEQCEAGERCVSACPKACRVFDGDQIRIRFRAIVDVQHVCENHPDVICNSDEDCDVESEEACIPNLEDFCDEFAEPDCKNSVKVEGAQVTYFPPMPSSCTSDPDCDDGLYCTGEETCEAKVCQRGAPPCAVEDGCFEETHTCGSHFNDVTICGNIHTCDAADVIDTDRERQNRVCSGTDELCTQDSDCPTGQTCVGHCDNFGDECTSDAGCSGSEMCGVDDNVADIDLVCHDVGVTKQASCDEPRLENLDLDPAAEWEDDRIEAIPGARVAFKIELCNGGEVNIPEVTINDNLSQPCSDWYAATVDPSFVATIKDIDTDEVYDVTECICGDAGHTCPTIADMNGTKTFTDCIPDRAYIKPGECLVITFQVDVPPGYDTICVDPECTNEVSMTGAGAVGGSVCGEPETAGGSDDVELNVLVPCLECDKLVCVDLDVDGDCDTAWMSLVELDPNSFEFPILLHYKYIASNNCEVDLDPVDIGDPGLIADVEDTDGVEINEDFYTCELDPMKNGGYKDCGALDAGDPCAQPPEPGDSCEAVCAVWIGDSDAWEEFAAKDEDGNDDCYTNVADTTGTPAPPEDVCRPTRPARVGGECFATVCLTFIPPCRPITKALFTIWNQNERKFEGSERCIYSWDEELLSRYAVLNNFLLSVLETDKAVAEIDGLRDAVVCTDESIAAPLLGVAMKVLDFEDERVGRSGIPLVAMGHEEGLIQYDPLSPSPPPELPGGDGGTPETVTEVVTDTGLTQLPGIPDFLAEMLAFELPQPDPEPLGVDRGDPVLAGTSHKGSLLVFTKVEIKWNPDGDLIQDTFIDLTNDWNYPVHVQLYLVRYCGLWVDNEIVLTGNEPTYWSAAEGRSADGSRVVSPFTVLGDGFADNDPHNLGGRKLHGYLLAWAVDPVTNEEVRWNHLKGDALIVNYQDKTAWEYPAWAFRAKAGDYNGDTLIDPPGELRLNGVEYDYAPAMLLLDFYASESVLSSEGAPQSATVDTDLTLWAAIKDLRQH